LISLNFINSACPFILLVTFCEVILERVAFALVKEFALSIGISEVFHFK